jgi:hypothetical protein
VAAPVPGVVCDARVSCGQLPPGPSAAIGVRAGGGRLVHQAALKKLNDEIAIERERLPKEV